MPRGRSWYGPGFWKEEGWRPGMGGYRRGYGGWMGPGPGWGGYGPGYCRWWAGPGTPGYYEPAFSGPDDEKVFLETQVEELKAELSEMETRINELEKS